MAETNQRPQHEIRLGRIVASIWENPAQEGVRYSVRLSRIYTDESGKWQRSESFGKNDLLAVARVAEAAFEKISPLVHRATPEPLNEAPPTES